MRTIAMSSLDTIRLDLEDGSTTDGEICPKEDIGLIDTELYPLGSLLHTSDPIDGDLRVRSHECEEIEVCLHISPIDNNGHFLNHICMIVYSSPYELRIGLEVKYSNILHRSTRHNEVLEPHSLEESDLEFREYPIIEYDRILMKYEW